MIAGAVLGVVLSDPFAGAYIRLLSR